LSGPVPFREAVRAWIHIAVHSFGGPAGQIAVMHRVLVEEKRWFREDRFLHALNYCMLLPGPEAQQLATYSGWLLHGWRGGLVAGSLFVLPGFLAILALSALYVGFREVAAVTALLDGVKAGVLAVVVHAVTRIGARVMQGTLPLLVAAAAFVGIFLLGVPFPAIVFGAALVGFFAERLGSRAFTVRGAADRSRVAAHPAPIADALEANPPAHTRPSRSRAVRVLAIGLALWIGPFLGLTAWLGPDHVLVQEGVLFGKAALVTFGGAYAVLAYVAQQAVEVHGWLAPGEMLDGLGLAETTPGPLVMVVQFVGFLGAYRSPAPFGPWTAAVLGSVVTVWTTFVPCFLWIFLGAPWMETLRRKTALQAALAAVTAAVVGVILNLAVWFGVHVLFGDVASRAFGPFRLLVPDPATIDPVAALLAAGAFVAMFRFRAGMLPVLGACAGIGMVAGLLGA
jgi:chromate transporter